MKQRVQEYLTYRHSLGFKLYIEGQQLLRFADYVDSKNYCGPITEELAIEWAKSSKKPSRFTWARRPYLKKLNVIDWATIDDN